MGNSLNCSYAFLSFTAVIILKMDYCIVALTHPLPTSKLTATIFQHFFAATVATADRDLQINYFFRSQLRQQTAYVTSNQIRCASLVSSNHLAMIVERRNNYLFAFFINQVSSAYLFLYIFLSLFFFHILILFYLPISLFFQKPLSTFQAKFGFALRT